MRRFTPIETNQLLKHGFDPFKIAKKVNDDAPVEYITGKAEFCEQTFEVNQHVLIPRIETEYLIELGLNFVMNLRKPIITFADVGTGSGAIGITFASELQKRHIRFKAIITDISKDALEIAEKNIETILPKPVDLAPSIIKIIESDLLAMHPRNLKYDLIFANLPYIPTKRLDRLPRSVREFEPVLALDGGIEGFDLIRKLLNQAQKFLTSEGIVLLEVDDTHTNPLEFLTLWDIQIKNDFNGKNRFWICKKRI